MAIDQHAPAFRMHQRVEHAQRGGLAGAVGAKQAGDFPVARLEADVVDRDHGRRLAFSGAGECLAQVFCNDHVRVLSGARRAQGSQPLKEVKGGAYGTLSRHLASSDFASALSMNCANSLGMHPVAITLWPCPRTTRWRPLGSVLATSSP